MIDFDYDALNALSAVVREGTFDAAAKYLNVTQSAVSQRIKQLEERLGAIVIVRGRPCVPTEYGLQLCRHLDQVLLLEHDLKRAIGTDRDKSDMRAVLLKVAVNSDSLSTWFPAVINRVQSELNANFEIMTEDQEHSASKLKSSEAMAALTSSDQPIQGFRHIALGAMEYMAIASPSFLHKHCPDGVTFESLKSAPSIVFDRKDTLPEQWLKLAFGETHKLHGSMVPSNEGYLHCCIQGTGWGMMPTEAILQHVKMGRLVELVPGKRTRVSLFWQSSAHGTAIFNQLSKIVTEEASKTLVKIDRATTKV